MIGFYGSKTSLFKMVKALTVKMATSMRGLHGPQTNLLKMVKDGTAWFGRLNRRKSLELLSSIASLLGSAS